MSIYEDREDFFSRPRSSAPGYSMAVAPEGGPAGTVFVPELGTYVDSDIADSMGIAHSRAEALSRDTALSREAFNPAPVSPHRDTPDTPSGTSRVEHGVEHGVEEYEEAHSDTAEDDTPEIEEEAVQIDSPSETLKDVAACFTPSEFDAGMTELVDGNLEGAVDRITEATGLDSTAAISVIEAAIEDVAPHAQEQIGHDEWNALVYAATCTEDPAARQIVAGVVQGKLPLGNLSKAYSLWWHSLPDAATDTDEDH